MVATVVRSNLLRAAFPLSDFFDELDIRKTKGAALVKSGAIKTFMIGARRYITAKERERFIQNCIRESQLADSPEQRSEKSAKATAASLKKRAEQRARAASGIRTVA